MRRRGIEAQHVFAHFARVLHQKFLLDMAKVLEMPAVKERLASLGATPAFMGPAEWDRFVRDYVVRMRKLGDAVGIKPQ